MRLARVAMRDGHFLVRVDGEVAVPLMLEDDGKRDSLRRACASGVSIRQLPPVGAPVSLQECRMLAPIIRPGKIICIGLNYRDHAEEAGFPIPEQPLCFAKTVNTVIGHEEAVTCPEGLSEALDYEAEVAVIIGQETRQVSPSDALDFVFGYTLCNDVTARDVQFSDGQWFRGKSFDTFLPLGPCVVTADELQPDDITFVCKLNGVVMQRGSVSNMIFSIPYVVSYISQFLTLEAGDVIATGTPAGVGYMRQPPVRLGTGDVVEIASDQLGRLRNTVSIASIDHSVSRSVL
jgi:2-keto-4-pentenoate hydratase/2-oxohepta-3-ene-1,7-dioic acid hydratase in catechol pathway